MRFTWRDRETGKARSHAFLVVSGKPFIVSVCGWAYLENNPRKAERTKCHGCEYIVAKATSVPKTPSPWEEVA